MTKHIPGERQLRFTIGPVQAFVAQSRRTRDLWSSSFLLSYLAGCAVNAIEAAGCRVVLPHVDGDPLREAIRNSRGGRLLDTGPHVGSIPNQLTAEGDDPAAAGRAGAEAISEAWRRITEEVWNLVEKAATAHGRGSREIWDRQVKGFWQVLWVVGGADALARRKAWRGGHREAEPGDKCTLMVGWQELSGYHRAIERLHQNRFWEGLHGHGLRDDERLCALALVKRLFPAVAKEAIGWSLDTVHWPSTPYLAARPWVEDVLTHGGDLVKRESLAYASAVRKAAAPDRQEESGSKRLRGSTEIDAGDRSFLQLDGSFFFQDDLALPDRAPLIPGADRKALQDQLKALSKAVGKVGRRAVPSRFYAVLLLDGDRLGKTFDESPDRGKASQALGRFAGEAVERVEIAGGLAIYAGGDDLLAFLPLPTAFATAAKLARLYEEMLGPVAGANKVTTSAALVFAHCRSPLRAVIETAHRLLDDEAKEANGRGSIAVAVWKSTGVTVRWVTTWERPDAGEASDRLAAIVEHLAADEVSTSFLFGQRVVFTRLAGVDPWRPGLRLELPEGIDAEPLVRAELARAKDSDPAEVAGIAEELVEVMTPVHRNLDGALVRETSLVGLDPLLLAQFLRVERPGEVR